MAIRIEKFVKVLGTVGGQDSPTWTYPRFDPRIILAEDGTPLVSENGQYFISESSDDGDQS